MSAIRINGIRVGHQMFHLLQYPDADSDPLGLLYRSLAGDGINSPCMGMECNSLGQTVCCCIEEDISSDHKPVCMVSVYPHGSNSSILGFLISLFGRHRVEFFHMVSSSAMISFVILQSEKQRVLSLLETAFDLPPTHTPYEPGFHEETAAFVKQRYHETRAYFQEEKIKTYGFDLTQDLDLNAVRCSLDRLEQVGNQIQSSDAKFNFATAFGHDLKKNVTLYYLYRKTDDRSPDIESQSETEAGEGDRILTKVDMVYFHGPHFGDRFGIFNAAALCLEAEGIEFLLAGCTGASVTLVLKAGLGENAITALMKGFESP